MSRTDKDTPYWVIEKTHRTRYERHDHTRANNHGILAQNGEHYCSINDEVVREDRYFSGRFLYDVKFKKRLAQHIASGTCKKSVVREIQCNHDIFDRPINYPRSCTKTPHWREMQAKWYMDMNYSRREVIEWVKLNGIVSSHTITKTIPTPNTPCKCDQWTFYHDCTYEGDWDHLDHGLTGWGRHRRDDFDNEIIRAELNRRAWRDELHEARYMDWRSELAGE